MNRLVSIMMQPPVSTTMPIQRTITTVKLARIYIGIKS